MIVHTGAHPTMVTSSGDPFCSWRFPRPPEPPLLWIPTFTNGRWGRGGEMRRKIPRTQVSDTVSLGARSRW